MVNLMFKPYEQRTTYNILWTIYTCWNSIQSKSNCTMNHLCIPAIPWFPEILPMQQFTMCTLLLKFVVRSSIWISRTWLMCTWKLKQLASYFLLQAHKTNKRKRQILELMESKKERDPWFSSELVMQNSNRGNPTNVTEESSQIFISGLQTL